LRLTVRISNVFTKDAVHTERVTSILMKVKSFNVWLRVSLVRVTVYLKLLFRYKSLILYIFHADIVYLHEE
jgi:hypothetical protein